MTFYCDYGKHDAEQPEGTLGTGYGLYEEAGKELKACYICCATRDRKKMDSCGRAVLYLTKRHGSPSNPLHYDVTNWPGTLVFGVKRMKSGRHNIAGTRTDVWFMVGGTSWHGVQYGSNSQLTHCRRTTTPNH